MIKYFKNALIYGEDFEFHRGSFSIKDGFFDEVLYNSFLNEAIDLDGAKVIPGLIDMNAYGSLGHSFDATTSLEYQEMTLYMLKNGVTSFAASFFDPISCKSEREMEKSIQNCISLNTNSKGSMLRAFCFSERNYENEDFGSDLSRKILSIANATSGLPFIINVPPEYDTIERLSNILPPQAVISIENNNLNHIDARKCFASGAILLSHTYCGMPAISFNDGGPIAAANEYQNVLISVIADGIHVHEATLRATYRLFGGPRIAIVSAASPVVGLDDGNYCISGEKLYVQTESITRFGPDNNPIPAKMHKVTSDTNYFCGSALNLYETMLSAMSLGIRPEAAIRGTTEVPAKILGIADRVGQIKPGMVADFIVTDDKYNICAVYLAGKVC